MFVREIARRYMDWNDRFYIKSLSNEDVSGSVIDVFRN
jgi:hypothetical protein